MVRGTYDFLRRLNNLVFGLDEKIILELDDEGEGREKQMVVAMLSSMQFSPLPTWMDKKAAEVAS